MERFAGLPRMTRNGRSTDEQAVLVVSGSN